MKWIKSHWLELAFLLFAIVVISYNIKVISDCEGTPVRGLFSMECVEGES